MKLRRRNPGYYRTIIRIVGSSKDKIRVVIPGWRNTPFNLDKSLFKGLRVRRGTRLIGEVTLDARKPGEMKVKNLSRLPKPSKEVLDLFKKKPKRRKRRS